MNCMKRILTNVNTSTTYPIARRRMQLKYKQHIVAQLEVTSSRCPLILTLLITISIDTTQGRARKVPRMLYGIILKCWLCARVSCAFTQSYTDIDGSNGHRSGHRRKRTMQCTNIC